jgi:hypothetical protein
MVRAAEPYAHLNSISENACTGTELRFATVSLLVVLRGPILIGQG